jgi:DnaJ-class molecular chaperone
MKDLYQILGVPESADDDTIKKAYRKLAKANHPDATGGDTSKTERFKEVNAAYDIVGDRQKRAEYDRLRRAPIRPDGMPEGFDADSFEQVFGGDGRFGGRGVRVDMGGDIGDIFSNLFGGAADPWGRRRGRVARGPDLAGTLELTFEEAALGTKRTIRPGARPNVEVTVPPGAETGARLKLAGQGGPAPEKGGVPGDLIIDILVKPHPHLRRADGPDVALDLPLSLSEAILGAKIDVPTVEGPVRLSVPPGTSSGAKLRLRGKGVRLPNGSRGDQICRIEIVVPKIASDDKDAQKLVEDLAQRTQTRPPRSF